MIIEVNTKLLNLDKNLNASQLIFLGMVLDKNQISYNQDVQKVLSLISEDDISYLVAQNLVSLIEKGKSKVYVATDKLKESLIPDKDYFDIFFDTYPIYVLRPDGTKSFLRSNVNKCRNAFNSATGNSESYKEHIIECLKYDIQRKTNTGNMGYMKTMWRWLTEHQWEEIEQEMQFDVQNTQKSYGTDII